MYPVDYNGVRVLTTEQLAQAYECETVQISQNFLNNKDHFKEGKHFFKLEGDALKNLRLENIELQISPKARCLYLWTRRGASRHCKMLGTEKAWEMYDNLEENYFTPRPSKELTGRELMAKALIEAQAVLAEKDTTIAKQAQIIGELKPKADYTDRILQSKELVAITQIAKDYGMSGQAMNKQLHELGVIYKLGEQWLLYSRWQAKGYTHSEIVPIIKHSDGTGDVKMNTKWTQKGRLFLYEFLKKHGVLPVIEQDRDEKPLLN